ncbi:MAG: CDP-diacylglycerol--glycerol-3-phosphate 3-phosphatidyltransferase [Spirochaetales bacterium]|nr:CDP-diacylglycerol--glycerol-3-phosphate 3-phosphatidyltransferase [Leptospiraceae bacterium]MCP5480716.1 CDP-diacylglycerol--glycerol-3-phosphate 3-phosphatidyltransferase [Spirochaetales bacterium]MCP5484068.1 CDP-diacylglycerol--glycerol-3-phosphate 3-phosphatidyltransferase [Spirochaetales bacterium]
MKIVWNLPNVLTALRLASVPFFIYLLAQPDIYSRWIAFFLFAAASITDLVDGYIARKYRQETELGKFLDPLADKALVIGAFVTFLLLSAQIEMWMVACVIGRDMFITFLRWLAIRKGQSLRTSVFGKVKTAFQMLAISVIIVSFLIVSLRERQEINAFYYAGRDVGMYAWDTAAYNLGLFINGSRDHSVAYALASFLPYYFMLVTTIVTIISGLRYLFTNYKLLLPPYGKVPMSSSTS